MWQGPTPGGANSNDTETADEGHEVSDDEEDPVTQEEIDAVAQGGGSEEIAVAQLWDSFVNYTAAIRDPWQPGEQVTEQEYREQRALEQFKVAPPATPPPPMCGCSRPPCRLVQGSCGDFTSSQGISSRAGMDTSR